VRAKREARPRQPTDLRAAKRAPWQRGSEQREASRESQGIKLHGIEIPKKFPEGALRARRFAPTPSRVGKHMSPTLLQVGYV
jgi:hypothetical protein